MKNILFILTILMAILSGCKKSAPEDYTFKYSMEYVNNYKIECTIDSKTNAYTIVEYNYLFDNFEKKRDPLSISGILSAEESNQFASCIEMADLFKLDDTYGFDESTDFVCQSYIVTPTKEKFITSSYVNNQLPTHYYTLVSFMNKFISEHKKKK